MVIYVLDIRFQPWSKGASSTGDKGTDAMTATQTYQCEIALHATICALNETTNSARRSRLARKAQAIRRQIRGN